MIITYDQLTETSTSVVEPVSLYEAKQHMRVDIPDDNIFIQSVLTAAREHVEQHCNRSFAAHTYRADLPGFYDVMELPMRPVQSITHIKYYDTASPSVLQTLANTVYALNNGVIRRGLGQSWLSTATRADAVQITFVTGWRDNSSPQGVGADCPHSVKAAILLLMADLYEHREYQLAYPGQLLETRTFKMLLAPHRVYQ